MTEWYKNYELARTLLREKPAANEKLRDNQEVQQALEDALYEIDGYDFQIEIGDEDQQYEKFKSYNCVRTVHIRLECKNCPQKKWTSICGTLHIRFKIRDIPKNPKGLAYPKKIIFNSEIYRMECIDCHEYGEVKIYDSQLEAVEIQFANIVANIMDGHKKSKPKNKKKHEIPDIHKHLWQLCEACKKDICVYKKILKEWDKQTKRINKKTQVELDLHVLSQAI